MSTIKNPLRNCQVMLASQLAVAVSKKIVDIYEKIPVKSARVGWLTSINPGKKINTDGRY